MATQQQGADEAERPARTGRNIVILSDGTGQRGGILVDERRSNVYKLFRATRCGPDSSVDPALQVAFYDAGLGTLPGGIDSPAAFARTLYNVASQATGMGIRHDAPRHPSVLDRFAADAVAQYDLDAPYRPANLRHHDAVKHLYEDRAAEAPR